MEVGREGVDELGECGPDTRVAVGERVEEGGGRVDAMDVVELVGEAGEEGDAEEGEGRDGHRRVSRHTDLVVMRYIGKISNQHIFLARYALQTFHTRILSSSLALTLSHSSFVATLHPPAARLTWPTRIHNLFVRTTTTTQRHRRPTRAQPDSLAPTTTTTTTPTSVRPLLSPPPPLTPVQQQTPPQRLAMAPAPIPPPSSPRPVSPMAPPLVTPARAHIPTPLGPPTSKSQSPWKR